MLEPHMPPPPPAPSKARGWIFPLEEYTGRVIPAALSKPSSAIHPKLALLVKRCNYHSDGVISAAGATWPQCAAPSDLLTSQRRLEQTVPVHFHESCSLEAAIVNNDVRFQSNLQPLAFWRRHDAAAADRKQRRMMGDGSFLIIECIAESVWVQYPEIYCAAETRSPSRRTVVFESIRDGRPINGTSPAVQIQISQCCRLKKSSARTAATVWKR